MKNDETIKKVRTGFKLKYRIFFTFLIPSIISIILLSSSLYVTTSKIMNKRLLQSAGDTLVQTSNSMQNFFSKYDSMTLSYSLAGSVQALLSQDLTNYNINRQKKDKLDFESVLFTSVPTRIENSNSSCGIRLYFNNSFPYFYNGTRYFNYSNADVQAWFLKIKSGYEKDRSSFYVISPKENEEAPVGTKYVSLARVILDKKNYHNFVAILMVDIPKNYLDTSIRSENFEGIINFLSTEDDNLLAVSDSEKTELFPKIEAAARQGVTNEDDWTKITIDHVEYMVKSIKLSPYSLTVTTMIPYKSIAADIYILRNYILVITGFLLFLCLYLSELVAKNITSRLLYISEKMKEVRTGSLSPFVLPETPTRDEIDDLIDTYNYMIGEMELLIEKQYQNGKDIKSAELKVLQEQINPHFLYNTLDMIRWFTEEGMLEEIKTAISSLAKYYRISLSNGREIISLKEELTHVDAYICLINLRYKNAIHYIVDVPEEFESCSIIKTILQPLVENSILHGLFEKDTKHGEIHINAYQEDNELVLVICDNGIGMPPEQVEALNRNSYKTPMSQGYAIQNINSRFQLYYGPSYLLRYESTEGTGTKVYVRIPYK